MSCTAAAHCPCPGIARGAMSRRSRNGTDAPGSGGNLFRRLAFCPHCHGRIGALCGRSYPGIDVSDTDGRQLGNALFLGKRGTAVILDAKHLPAPRHDLCRRRRHHRQHSGTGSHTQSTAPPQHLPRGSCSRGQRGLGARARSAARPTPSSTGLTALFAQSSQPL